ncbi:MAG: response regulator [bacterium]|nr:response regulator [bacterium]
MSEFKSRHTILVVEDDFSTYKALVTKLVQESYIVLSAKNGLEGLDQALRNHPDIILLDIVMPGMDGLTMLKKLREEGAWGKNVPVILLSNLEPDNKINASIVRDEPAYYVVKANSSIDDLITKIKERLGR